MSQQVIQALEDQVGCYRRLAKLTEVQHAHVQQGETEALLGVLKSRQGVLDQISQLESVLAPSKGDWTHFVGKIAGDLRGRAESLLAEKRRLLEQITIADRDDALVLQQRKLNLGRQIHQASAAKQVNRTYATAAYGVRSSRMDVQR